MGLLVDVINTVVLALVATSLVNVSTASYTVFPSLLTLIRITVEEIQSDMYSSVGRDCGVGGTTS